MSDTTTQGTGVIEHIDPHTLTIETNIRTEARLTDEFIDSIRDNGVLVPVLAWREQGGQVFVRAGQRRTLAAREAALPTIPVYVITAPDADTATRLVEQLVENEQRTELTDNDRIAAWQQLAFEGLTVNTIAKRTGTRPDRVASGLTVAASRSGTNLLGQVTLDQAAVLVEFENSPTTLDELTAVAENDPDYFPVAVQRARDETATRARIEEVERAQAARGHRVLTARPAWHEAPYPLHQIRTEDGEPVSADDVVGRAGVAVHVTATPWRDDEPIAIAY